MNQFYHNPPPQPHYGHYPPMRHQYVPYRKPVRQFSSAIGAGLLIMQGLWLVLAFVIYGAFSALDFSVVSPAAYDMVEQSLDVIIYVLAFWLPTLFIALRIGIPSEIAFPLRLPKASLWIPGLMVALGTSVVGSYLSAILSMLMESAVGSTPYMPPSPLPVGIGSNIVYVISIAIVPAIFEELLFRGVIMQSLRRFGDGFALVMSSLLFGLMHGNLIQAPNAMLTGLVIGYFVLRTGSLLTGMIIHFANNGLVVLFTYLEQYTALGMQGDRVYSILYGLYLMMGVAGVALLFILHRNVFGLARSDYPLPTGQKVRAFFSSALMILFVLFCLFLMGYYVA